MFVSLPAHDWFPQAGIFQTKGLFHRSRGQRPRKTDQIDFAL